MPKFLYAIRTRLLLIVVLAVLPSIILTVVNSSEARRTAVKNVRDDLQNLTLILTEEEKNVFEDENRFLASLSSFPEIRSGDATACSQRLAAILEANPNHLNLGVIDKNGLVFCSGIPSANPVDASDRPYFQHALENKVFSVGEYQIGRITGKASINFGQPIFDDRGNVARVVFAAMDLSYLNRMIQETLLPEGATVTMLDRNGVILSRYPENGELAGKTIQNEAIFEAILEQNGNGSLASAGLDGTPRLFVFNQPLISQQTSDTYLLVGIPEAIAYADADRLLGRSMAGIAIASISALAAAWLISHWTIIHPLQSLMTATRGLAAGDLKGRVRQVDGRGELSQLASAFNEMASALEQRTLEMQQAHEALKVSETHYRTVFEDVPAGLYRTTPDGKILDANPALLEMFGYPDQDSIRSVNTRDFYIHPAEREQVVILLENEDLVREYETQFRRFDGTVIWARDTMRAIRDANGRIQYYEGNLRDITAHKMAQEELRRSAARSQAFLRISSRLNAQLDLETVAQAVCEEAAKALDIAKVSLRWYDPQRKVLIHGAGLNLSNDNNRKTWLQPKAVSADLYKKLTQKENNVLILEEGLQDEALDKSPSLTSNAQRLVVSGLTREIEADRLAKPDSGGRRPGYR